MWQAQDQWSRNTYAHPQSAAAILASSIQDRMSASECRQEDAQPDEPRHDHARYRSALVCHGSCATRLSSRAIASFFAFPRGNATTRTIKPGLTKEKER